MSSNPQKILLFDKISVFIISRSTAKSGLLFLGTYTCTITTKKRSPTTSPISAPDPRTRRLTVSCQQARRELLRLTVDFVDLVLTVDLGELASTKFIGNTLASVFSGLGKQILSYFSVLSTDY